MAALGGNLRSRSRSPQGITPESEDSAPARGWQRLVVARSIAYDPLMTEQKRRLGRDAQRDRFNQRAREREQEAAPKVLSDDLKLDAMVKKSIADHGA